MKNKRKENDLFQDPNYWVRLGDGSVVSRMHYERVMTPPVTIHLSPEEQEKSLRAFREKVREIYRKRGYPIPDQYKD